MSELFMECVEEELEPWQKQAPQVHMIDDDDDEPIFVGVLCESSPVTFIRQFINVSYLTFNLKKNLVYVSSSVVGFSNFHVV